MSPLSQVPEATLATDKFTCNGYSAPAMDKAADGDAALACVAAGERTTLFSDCNNIVDSRPSGGNLNLKWKP